MTACMVPFFFRRGSRPHRLVYRVSCGRTERVRRAFFASQALFPEPGGRGNAVQEAPFEEEFRVESSEFRFI